jgi:hypothetical protein
MNYPDIAFRITEFYVELSFTSGHYPFYLKRNVSEAGFCFRTETETISIYWIQLNSFRLITETETSLRREMSQ